MLAFWIRNLLAYSAQIAILLVAGGLALKLLKLEPPKYRLLCWQLLLALSLSFPLAQPWIPGPSEAAVTISIGPTLLAQKPRVLEAHLPWAELLALIIAGGTLVRLAIFCIGLVRLSHYARRSCPAPVPSLNMNTRAQIRMSDEISGPVTFGIVRPLILIPERWATNEAILCHELIHVRRRDWIFVAVEQLIRALLWFHPLVWWAISQIQLAREEAVDREVVQLLQSREQYLETLLAIAAAQSGLDLAPAPLFLRKRHLKSRVASLMKEVKMSRIHLHGSLAGFAALTLAAGWLAVHTFPLQAAPEPAQHDSADKKRTDQKPIRIKPELQQKNLIKKVQPVYPAAAKAAGIQGAVHLSVEIGRDGKVKDVQIIDGDPQLADSAVEAVRQWEYRPTLLNGDPVDVITEVTVNYTLAK